MRPLKNPELLIVNLFGCFDLIHFETPFFNKVTAIGSLAGFLFAENFWARRPLKHLDLITFAMRLQFKSRALF
jgi:hypothetical protein